MGDPEKTFVIDFFGDGTILVRAAEDQGYTSVYEAEVDGSRAEWLVKAIDAVMTPYNKVLEGFLNWSVAERKQRLSDLREERVRLDRLIRKLGG